MDSSQKKAIVVVALLGAITASVVLWGATKSDTPATKPGLLAQMGHSLTSLGHSSRVATSESVVTLPRQANRTVSVLPSNSQQPGTVSITLRQPESATASYQDNGPAQPGAGNCSLPPKVPNPQVVKFPVTAPNWAQYSSEAAKNSAYFPTNPSGGSITVTPCGGRLTLACNGGSTCTFTIK